MVELHQLAAVLYLVAGIGALHGVVLSSRRMVRVSVVALALGALVHAAAFATLHRVEPTPQLTELAPALSLMSWMAVLFLLLLMWRARLAGLAALAGPVAFLGAFFAALRLPHRSDETLLAAGSWPHAHVLLASGGLALLGLAGLAGVFFLIESRRLKSHRPFGRRLRLPTLEALDRVNVLALAVGFPLLTLGVITGMMWLEGTQGRLWTGTPHETWSAAAWGIYALLALARFAGRQGARQAAASAVAGFAFLLFAVVGVGLVT
jgi:ABC-type uncharacterized transport system permease subunit